jgi:hypothetical protein
VSLSIVFLVYLCLVFRMVDMYTPVVECPAQQCCLVLV